MRKQTNADRLLREFGDMFVPLLFDVTDETAFQLAAEKVDQGLNSARAARSRQRRKDRPLYGALSVRLWEQRGRVGFPLHALPRKRKRPCRLRNRGPWPSLFPAHCRFVLGNRRGRLKGTGRTSNLRPQPDASGVRRTRAAPGLS